MDKYECDECRWKVQVQIDQLKAENKMLSKCFDEQRRLVSQWVDNHAKVHVLNTRLQTENDMLKELCKDAVAIFDDSDQTCEVINIVADIEKALEGGK